MTAAAPRAYALSGRRAPLALEWLHVHAEVCGAWEADELVTVYVRGALPSLPFADVAVREVAIAAEVRTGLEDDAVIAVADDLVVRPPWIDPPSRFRGIELVVPRGGAFGSGEHASTQLALRALHALWNAPASVADIGTGSGVLLLYASVRGCRDLQACDIDPAAVAAARELLPDADVRAGGPETMRAADCVVANLGGPELLAASSAIFELWTGRGPLVLGGMRGGEVDAIRARMPTAPSYRESRDGFVALGVGGATR